MRHRELRVPVIVDQHHADRNTAAFEGAGAPMVMKWHSWFRLSDPGNHTSARARALFRKGFTSLFQEELRYSYRRSRFPRLIGPRIPAALAKSPLPVRVFWDAAFISPYCATAPHSRGTPRSTSTRFLSATAGMRAALSQGPRAEARAGRSVEFTGISAYERITEPG